METNFVEMYNNWWDTEGEMMELTKDMDNAIIDGYNEMDSLISKMKKQKFYHSKYIRPSLKRKRKEPGIPPGFEKKFGAKKSVK